MLENSDLVPFTAMLSNYSSIYPTFIVNYLKYTNLYKIICKTTNSLFLFYGMYLLLRTHNSSKLVCRFHKFSLNLFLILIVIIIDIATSIATMFTRFLILAWR